MLFFSLLVSASLGIRVKITTKEKIDATSFSNFSLKNNLLLIDSSVENIGSVSYLCRLRTNAYTSNASFLFWSYKKELKPGETRNFKIYSFLPQKGEYRIEISGYCGNQIFDFKNFSLAVSSDFNDSLNYKIINSFVVKNFLVLEIYSDRPDIVYVIPFDYPSSWIFESQKISLKKGQNLVFLRFVGPLEKQEVGIAILNESGKGSLSRMLIKKENYLISFLRLSNTILSIFLRVW